MSSGKNNRAVQGGNRVGGRCTRDQRPIGRPGKGHAGGTRTGERGLRERRKRSGLTKIGARRAHAVAGHCHLGGRRPGRGRAMGRALRGGRRILRIRLRSWVMTSSSEVGRSGKVSHSEGDSRTVHASSTPVPSANRWNRPH